MSACSCPLCVVDPGVPTKPYIVTVEVRNFGALGVFDCVQSTRRDVSAVAALQSFKHHGISPAFETRGHAVHDADSLELVLGGAGEGCDRLYQVCSFFQTERDLKQRKNSHVP